MLSKRMLLLWILIYSLSLSTQSFARNTKETPYPKKYGETQLISCYRIAIDTERLSCFDKFVNTLLQNRKKNKKSQTSKEEKTKHTPQKMVSSSNLVEPSLEEPSFGLSPSRKKAKQFPEKVVLQVKTFRRDFYQRLIIITKGGQIWKQTDTRRIPVSKRTKEYRLRIRSKRFGGFTAQINNSRSFHIRRVQ